MDRKTILTVLVVTAAFLLFTSEPWRKLVRKTFGLPTPTTVSETVSDTGKVVSAKESKSDTATPSMGPSIRDTSARKSDSATAQASDSLAKLAKRRIVIRTPQLQTVISGEGGRIEGLQLRTVQSRAGGQPWILPEGKGGALALQVAST